MKSSRGSRGGKKEKQTRLSKKAGLTGITYHPSVPGARAHPVHTSCPGHAWQQPHKGAPAAPTLLLSSRAPTPKFTLAARARIVGAAPRASAYNAKYTHVHARGINTRRYIENHLIMNKHKKGREMKRAEGEGQPARGFCRERGAFRACGSFRSHGRPHWAYCISGSAAGELPTCMRSAGRASPFFDSRLLSAQMYRCGPPFARPFQSAYFSTRGRAISHATKGDVR